MDVLGKKKALHLHRMDGERFATFVEIIEQRDWERQRAERAEQAQRDAISKLLAMGLSVEQIAEVLWLPVDVVRAVQ
jgi:predicted transposase YdaD